MTPPRLFRRVLLNHLGLYLAAGWTWEVDTLSWIPSLRSYEAIVERAA
jgi:hypothetical protein